MRGALLGDVAVGKTSLADTLFLIALILFVIVAAIEFANARAIPLVLLAVGLVCTAAGFLVL